MLSFSITYYLRKEYLFEGSSAHDWDSVGTGGMGDVEELDWTGPCLVDTVDQLEGAI